MISYKIYKNNIAYDITNDIISNVINQNRSDDAFAVGALKIKTDQLSNAIPPYTFMSVQNDGVYEQYLVSSKSNPYLTYNNLYVHEITVLEPAAKLCCYIIGSKSFSTTGSNSLDKDKLNIIARLISWNYNIKLHFLNSSIITKSEKYSFGENTNLFTILNEIALRHNCKLKVSFRDYKMSDIYIEFVDLSGGSVYELDNSRILNIERYQNSDDYCNMLECDAHNVIDRDIINKANNLTMRVDGIVASDENAYLELPTRYEKITKLQASYEDIEVVAYLYYKQENTAFKPYLSDIKTFREWVELIPFIYGAYEKYLNFVPIDILNQNKFQLLFNQPLQAYLLTNSPLVTNNKLIIDTFLDLNILPKAKYDILLKDDKPKFAYFESYSNKIYGLNTYANTDFWSSIIAGTTGPAFKYPNNIVNEDVDDTYLTHVEIQNNFSDTTNTKSIHRLFNVEYIPCADMKIKSYKSIQPSNELGWKDITRTYGNKANFIDYNKITKSMQTTVDMLGAEEISIEYNVTGIEPPYATQKIIVDNIPYYVASVDYENAIIREIATINLTRSYNKVCEAIGISTGYNETKLPNNDIIDRLVYLEMTINETFSKDNLFVRMHFRNELKDKWHSEDYYKRPSVFTDDEGITLVVEMYDHYCIDRSVKRGTGGYVITEYPYGDNDNEFETATISLCYPNFEMTIADSMALPTSEKEWNVLTDEDVEVYKDARERLIFTIRLKSANINLLNTEE